MLNLKPATLALLLVLPCITWQGIAIKVSTATASPSNIALMEGIISNITLMEGIRRTAVGAGSWHRSCLLNRDRNVPGGFTLSFFSLLFCLFYLLGWRLDGTYKSQTPRQGLAATQMRRRPDSSLHGKKNTFAQKNRFLAQKNCNNNNTVTKNCEP